MTSRTQIGVILEQIIGRLNLLDSRLLSVNGLIRKALTKEDVNVDEIIQDYELTAPAYNIIYKRINNVLIAVHELEMIRWRSEKKDETHGTWDSFYVKTWWELIFTELNSILLIFVSIGVLNLSDFPTLNYIRLYRNRFIIHPNLDKPFNDFWLLSNMGVPENISELPTTNFGPGGGSDFWCEYHRHDVGMEIDHAVMIEDNYAKFIGMTKEEWKNINLEDRSKIIAFGLPNPTSMQKQISEEVEKMFFKKVVPYFEKQINFVIEKYCD